ncbi:hypothetical protein V1477_011486 [Vespula maculifrons]|uniref:Uncharacterized protein n=1 Tax=Vespula maculifrons TaxID=7453 RepID=A0ABD2BZC4_VESMC
MPSQNQSRLRNRRCFYNSHFYEDLYCSSINSNEIYQILALLMYNVSLLLHSNNNRKTINDKCSTMEPLICNI